MKPSALLAGLAAISASVSAANFRVYDNTAYTNTSIGFGTSSINWIPNYVCSPLLAAGSLPSADTWKAVVRQWLVYPGYPLVLDCEQLYLNDADTADQVLDWLATLQTWAADVLPTGSVIGWYGLASNTNTALYGHLRTLVANHTPTAFFPPAYTYSYSLATWKASLASALSKAAAVNSSIPVIPYVWPQYHGNYSFFPVDLWEGELAHLKSLESELSGFVIWGGKNHAVCNDACQATAGQQPWLAATRTFLTTLYGLYTGVAEVDGGQVFGGV